MSERLCGFHSRRPLATTRTLSEVGESSASLVPDPKDRHHLAQTCESLQCRDCSANCNQRRANAAPSSSLNLWRAGVEARPDGTSERRTAVSMSAMRARRLQAAIANNRTGPARTANEIARRAAAAGRAPLGGRSANRFSARSGGAPGACAPRPLACLQRKQKSPPLPKGFPVLFWRNRNFAARAASTCPRARADQLLAWAKGSAGILPA